MKYFLLCFALLVSGVCHAQNEEILTNESVIQLAKLGLGESVVVNKIKASKTAFDVSIPGLTELKKQGVSDAIINAMVERANMTPNDVTVNSNDPLSAHPAGIYYWDSIKGELKPLMPTMANQTKTGGVAMVFTMGIAKAKTKKSVPGISSRTKIKDAKPVFYFYIPETDQGAQVFNGSFSATSPNDFILILFTPNEKTNEREIGVGSYNVYSSQSGIDNTKTTSFKFEKKKSGIYKVTVDQVLVPGEYAFMYANNDVSRVFDFSIQ